MAQGVSQATLRRQVLQTLQQHIFDNLGSLRPNQLHVIADELAQLADDAAPIPNDLGQRLNQQGLALSSLLHAGTTLLRGLIEDNDPATALTTSERLTSVVRDYHDSDLRRVRDEQQQIQDAVRQVMAERERQNEQLQTMIHELSTPVVPVYQGILVVPLIGAIDARRSSEITARLLEHISSHHATTVIIDITGVPVVDGDVAQHLLHTTRAANLLGTEALIVGINPIVAQTIVQLGIDLSSMVTLSDLEQGIAYALRRRGLGILPSTS